MIEFTSQKISCNIGITAAGCPGASTFISQLKRYFPNCKFIGLDASPLSVGKYICDDFMVIPKANDVNFIPELQKAIKTFSLDLLWIINSKELMPVSQWVASLSTNIYSNCQIIVPDINSLSITENKGRLYDLCKSLDVNVPNFRKFTSCDEFIDSFNYLKSIGVESFCFKPSVSSGSRGFRILQYDDFKKDIVKLNNPMQYFLSSKPYADFNISFESAVQLFSSQDSFPEMLLMEKVSGLEIDAMLFADVESHESLLISQKTRSTSRSGVIMSGEHVWNDEISSAVSIISKELDLSHFNGFQLIGGSIIEINPRVSSFIYTKSWCEPAFALAYYLRLLSGFQLKEIMSSYPLGAKLIRYFDCIVDA